MLVEQRVVAHGELTRRISEDPFDGGRTARWLAALGPRATFRSVRDSRTGHTIHCVSDRPSGELTADLRLGLRLLAWMSWRPMVWYWWDQPWVRVLPAGVDPERDHVNGGWAVPGIREVHVYRREEAHKVLLHECIHALKMDVPAAAVAPVRAALEAELGRTLWPHLGEAFTELMAEWLWSIASASSRRDAAARWSSQLTCSARQAAQVWVRVRDRVAPETTNIMAYYVLKWVLMGHAGAVLLAADSSVDQWLNWWRDARSRLEAMAQTESASERRALRMGMTCPSS